MSKSKDKNKEPKGDKKVKADKKAKKSAITVAPAAVEPRDDAPPILKPLPSFVRVAAEPPAAAPAPVAAKPAKPAKVEKAPKAAKESKPAKAEKVSKPAKVEKVKAALPARQLKPAKAPKDSKEPRVEKAPKAEAKTVTTVQIGFSIEDIALRAYFISENRRNSGGWGDSHGDWVEAERQLREEAAQRAK